MNPLLDHNTLPAFSELTPAGIDAALDEALSRHRSVIAEITERRPKTFAEAWLPYERAGGSIDALWSAVSHLSAVADTAELREAEKVGRARLVANGMEVEQNRDLYDVFLALAGTTEYADLPLEDRSAIERAIRNFELAGVSLGQEQRDRFRQISLELSDLSTDFASAVLDATDGWFEHVEGEQALNGLSNSDKSMLANAAKTRELDGWAVTLQQPSVSAILTFCENRDLRYRVYEAYGTRASDRGPGAGRFDNSQRIDRILELRREAATLLGFSDPVEWSLATKMATGAPAVLEFLRDLARRARPAARREFDEIAAFASSELGIDDLQPWDVAFASDRLRRSRYAIDEQEVRAYFPVSRVVAGWQRLLERLYGISLRLRDDVQLYHADAAYYDVADEGGHVIAGLYVDLHARQGKRGGAWMASARARTCEGERPRVPVAYLVCNFAPDGGDVPSLLSHSDIATLLHETGHALHHLFTLVNRPSVGGIGGFEWDAVELPSQLMEDFSWDRTVLTEMSGHHATGGQLPDEMFDRLLAARQFQSGMFVVRQIEFALFDVLLHLGTLGSDPIQVLEAVRQEVAVVQPPEWHRFPHSFSHIFAGGYAAGYYSYLWAEVLAADGFQAFAEDGLISRRVGDRFRREVLARGSTRSAAESFRAFRGRDASPDALLRRRGLVEAEA